MNSKMELKNNSLNWNGGMGRISEKQNCWEYMKCGRGPNGQNVAKLGVCPAATAEVYHGVNNGANGGRCCWKISGTMCFETIQGDSDRKLISCIQCSFFKKVKNEEKISFPKITPGMDSFANLNWWKAWTSRSSLIFKGNRKWFKNPFSQNTCQQKVSSSNARSKLTLTWHISGIDFLEFIA